MIPNSVHFKPGDAGYTINLQKQKQEETKIVLFELWEKYVCNEVFQAEIDAVANQKNLSTNAILGAIALRRKKK